MTRDDVRWAGGPKSVQLALLPICLAHPDASGTAAITGAIATLESLLGATHRMAPLLGNPALIEDGLRVIGRSLSPRNAHKLGALVLRERRRSALVADEHAFIAPLIARDAPGAVPLRGWHIATRAYPDPMARHSHALRWLIGDTGERATAISTLTAIGYELAATRAVLTPHKLVLSRRGGVAIELHDRPFPWRPRFLASYSCDDAAFMIVEIIGSALIEGAGRSMRWAIDIVRILRREAIDPGAFATLVYKLEMAGLARESLALVARALDAGESDTHARLAELRKAVRQSRDGKEIRDIRTLLAIAESGRARRLAMLLAHPRSWPRARALRAERRQAWLREMAIRGMLRQGRATLP